MPVGDKPAFRKVRAYLKMNGQRYPVLSGHATKSAQRKSDSFEATLSITATKQIGGMGHVQWANLEKAEAAIEFEVDGRSKEITSGDIKSVSIDWLAFTVSVQGQDKSARLAEKRSNKKHANKKSSDIVTEIAKDHGLQAQVVETDDDAGKKYLQDTAHLVINTTDFETVSQLAEREGYRWYVDGDTLHFEPKPEGKQGAYVVRYSPPTEQSFMTGNFIHLKTKRNLTAGRPTKMTVASYHHQDKKLYKHTEEAGGSGGSQIEYRVHVPGMNQDQVTKTAKSKLKNAIRHELALDGVDMPGDLDIDVTQGLQLQGTGTVFDQTYDIDQISFDLEWDSQFRMSVTTKAPKQGRAGASAGGSSGASAGSARTIEAGQAPNQSIG